MDADETLRAIRAGEVDALVLHENGSEHIFTLKGAERSYRLLVETMSEGAATFSDNGTILYCNSFFASMVGRPLELVMGARIEDFVFPPHRETFAALVRQGLERGSKAEITFAGPYTRSVAAYVSLSPLTGEDGAHLICLVATDLSAQKRSEDMLASERLATSVIEQATDAILVCDQDTRIIRASKGVGHFAMASPLFLPFRDAFRAEELRSIVTLALRGQTSRGVASVVDSNVGRPCEVLASAAPLHGHLGDIIGAIVTLTDVTSIKETQRELERAVKIRNDFLLIAAHELRTPLTSLHMQLASLQLLAEKSGAFANSDWERKLNTAARQTMRLIRLTQGLLDVSRLSSGHIELVLEKFDLTEAAREIVERCSGEAGRAGCELRFHDGSPSVGFWDGLRIEQALVNLILKATKYGPGKPIDVTVAVDVGNVVITVQDQGIGVAAADRERIFQLFERGVPSEHYGGLGIGLFITRAIVEASGGSIDVSSPSGRGSAFRICLPVKGVAAPDASQRTPDLGKA